MPTLSELTSREAVLKAIQEFDQLGREAFLEKYGFGKAKSYFLVHDGKKYDSKALVSAAHAFQHPDAERLVAFSGGEVTVKPKLESLGFTVEVAQKEERERDSAEPAPRGEWTPDELMVVLDAYFGLEDGRIANRGSEVSGLSRLTGRSEDAISLCLDNFRALAKPGSGFANGSATAKRFFEEHGDDSTAVHQKALGARERLAARPTAPRVWKIAPGRGAEFWDECRNGGVIVVGWNELGDLTKYLGGDEQQFLEDYRKAYPQDTDRSIQLQARMLWRFLNDVQVGDIVVANKGRSSVVGRGVVEGAYEYRAERATYRHVRRVRWVDTQERVVGDQGGGWMRTLLPISAQSYGKLFPEEGSRADRADVAPAMNSRPSIHDFLRGRRLPFPPELVTSYLLALKTKPFVILSGISGTGKTKLAQLVAEWAGSEEREIVRTLPEGESTAEADDVWLYKLRPYNFKNGKIVIYFGAPAEMFDLPEQNTVEVPIVYEGRTYNGGIGAFRSDGRLMHELRFRKELTEALKSSAAVGDFVRIRVERPDETQVVHIEKVGVRTERKVETIKRHTFISVRPDWMDGKGILGFFNVLTERYSPTPFLKRMLAAFAEPERPHFVILDEMNLARVEHYFSDLLSAMESRYFDNAGNLKAEPIHLHDAPQCLPLEPLDGPRPALCKGCKATEAEMALCRLRPEGVEMVPPRLWVPANLHITGTVNVDETTHMFSPKVLDRANVLEFNEVNLAAVVERGEASADGLDDELFRLDDIELSASTPATLSDYKELPPSLGKQIRGLNEVLAPDNLHFGYRVANEMGRFIRNAIAEIDEVAAEVALDLQILQKVLPKLHGTKQRLDGPLWRLLQFAAWGEVKTPEFSPDGESALLAAVKTAKYPRAAQKLIRMRQRLRDTGFASFIE